MENILGKKQAGKELKEIIIGFQVFGKSLQMGSFG
jgi:hypothetical protein